MKIFEIDFELNSKKNDVMYRPMVPISVRNYFKKFEELIAKGSPLPFDWDDTGKSNRSIANYFSTCTFGFTSQSFVINDMMKFAPSAQHNKVEVRNDETPYAMLILKNHEAIEPDMDHIFMMFHKHKKDLFTEVAKEYWESRGYTGAVFKAVDEIDDAMFKKVEI